MQFRDTEANQTLTAGIAALALAFQVCGQGDASLYRGASPSAACGVPTWPRRASCSFPGLANSPPLATLWIRSKLYLTVQDAIANSHREQPRPEVDRYGPLVQLQRRTRRKLEVAAARSDQRQQPDWPSRGQRGRRVKEAPAQNSGAKESKCRIARAPVTQRTRNRQPNPVLYNTSPLVAHDDAQAILLF